MGALYVFEAEANTKVKIYEAIENLSKNHSLLAGRVVGVLIAEPALCSISAICRVAYIVEDLAMFVINLIGQFFDPAYSWRNAKYAIKHCAKDVLVASIELNFYTQLFMYLPCALLMVAKPIEYSRLCRFTWTGTMQLYQEAQKAYEPMMGLGQLFGLKWTGKRALDQEVDAPEMGSTRRLNFYGYIAASFIQQILGSSSEQIFREYYLKKKIEPIKESDFDNALKVSEKCMDVLAWARGGAGLNPET